ncbi:MAG: ABC transporter substrate-binding protein [Actinobacteria bacterium]|nr:ABC transporter substrate-binding protein [Actinomycetota bacterium]
MSKKLLLAAVVALTSLTVALPGAFGKTAAGTTTAADPGLTARTITLGGTFPLSGPVSRYAPIAFGMKAYFSYINARRGNDGKRGVYGRQIIWKFVDDQYNPAQTVQLTRQLVEQDRVFATVGALGTEHQQAVQSYLNQRKVPQLLVSTGAATWGRDYQKNPYSVGWQPDYISEGRLYGQHIVQTKPDAKIGILFQNDDYGRDYIEGLEAGLGARRSQIIERQGVESTSTDVRAQLARLRASGADTFAIFVTPTLAIGALVVADALNWRPQIYLNSVSATDSFIGVATARGGNDATDGVISATYLKDPANPKWANDAGMKQFKRLQAKYYPQGNPNDQLILYGMAKAQTTVQILLLAGKNPTRASVLRAAQRLNFVNPFLLPGVRVKTSATDRFLISQQTLLRHQNGTWNEFGNLIEGRPGGR